ncbi:GMC family oxidoreductase [Nocardia higoensis]|uniref:Cholesterol oxidase n=1 Tax=Nocardia higoensis TaxID=228599 RepID=A0ABS0DGV3_9NOCA|nr:GMC oxidoreductase [Nocardia higoensis]MBF6357702.1 GMC family oxidoreductase [Nocardia higoensis]
MYDIVVVGSGFGGAIVAARLAQAGARVLVIERGPWWGSGDDEERLPFPRGRTSHRFLRNLRLSGRSRTVDVRVDRRGLFEVHRFDHLWTVGASGVGGGSLVYGDCQASPPPSYWDAFPPEITAAEMAEYIALSASVMRPAELPDWQRRGSDLGAAIGPLGGWKTEPVELAISFGADPDVPASFINSAGAPQTTCRLCNQCVAGCPHRAKNSLDLTYLQSAKRSGAVIEDLSDVSHVGAVTGGYRVRWLDHRTRRTRTADARRLVLAAGALNTTRLLFRSRAAGLLTALPPALGNNFNTNGDQATLLWRVASGPVTRGAIFNALAQGESDGDTSLFVGEASAPTSGRGRLGRELARSRFLFAMGASSLDGTLTFDGRGLGCTISRTADRQFYDHVDDVSSRLAKSYRPRRAMANFPFGSRAAGLWTVHMLGGAPMARRAEDAVVDHSGQVLGHPGLYIADGSVLPAAPGVPPSRTISALAERIAALAVEEQNR